MNLSAAREQMVAGQIRPWDVVDDAVLAVMSDLPRDSFMPAEWRSSAYADIAIPVGAGEYAFTPRLEGRILQAVGIKTGDSVLEVGCGSGYLSACLAQLGAEVLALDDKPELVDLARTHLSANDIERVNVQLVSGADALPNDRFDVVIVGGAIAHSRERFEALLREGGRLFVVDGIRPTMNAWRIERLSEDRWQRESLFETVLPYLRGFGPEARFEF